MSRSFTSFVHSLLARVGHAFLGLSELVPTDRPKSEAPPYETVARNGKWLTCRVGEFTWRLDTTQGVDSAIAAQSFEPASTKLVQTLVRPGMIAFDVGANIGYYTLQLSRLVGEGGRVYAFEPYRPYRDRLEEHLRMNRCQNVIVSEYGLADGPHQSTMFFDTHNTGSVTMAPLDDAMFVPSGSAILTSLDNFVTERNLQRLDFIKVDIDGFESRFVVGAKGTLRRFRPTMLMEFAHMYLLFEGSSAEALAAQLKDLDYYLVSEHTGRPFSNRVEFLTAACNCAMSINLLCIPKEKTLGQIRC